MKENANYRLLAPLKTVIMYFTGDIILDDIICLMKQLAQDHEYSPQFNVIVDFRDCNLNFNNQMLLDYIQFLSKAKLIARRKIAYLTSKPNEVVLTILYSEMVREHSLEIEVFSTSQAALNYIQGNGLNVEKLDNIILELKSQNCRSAFS